MYVQRVSAWPPLTFLLKTQLILNTHTIVAGIHQGMPSTDGQNRVVSDIHTLYHFSTRADNCPDSERVSGFDCQEIRCLTSAPSAPGVFPPSAPRVSHGRDELIGRIVRSAERLRPIALIGAPGIGKTSVILTSLHDDQITRRFGSDRRFIRCDEFPASRAHFLRQVSKVIGAGIENPVDLCSLQPFLSSKEMLIVLDNAESILDPEGPSGQEIYAVVDELTQFSNLCIWITSRISTIPPRCETISIPTLSAQAAKDAFHRIYQDGQFTSQVDGILEQLGYHPLSITLLATVAKDNRWYMDQLKTEWESQRTGVLRAQHSGSLGTAIEPSLTSPTFRGLGPHARSLLEAVAFFPQGVNEKNANWLFSTIPDVLNILNAFCAISLTYRDSGFITMLAPLRDHLRPKDPASSPLLNTTKENYFMRLLGEVHPGKPGFEETQWITTEDINIEHLLNVFTTTDANSESAWDACAKFMAQLYFHKPRCVVLGPKIEALPDDHPSKAWCLWEVSRLFESVGNFVECKRLLSHSLKLRREQGNDFQVAQTLRGLSDANRRLGLREEGLQQAKDAHEIFKRLGHVVGQAECSINLAGLLCDLATAEEAGSRAIDLLLEKGEEYLVCQAHRVLGEIYQSRGETTKAIHCFETALEIASSLHAVEQLFWVNHSLAEAFSEQGKFKDAQTRLEHAKSHAVNRTYLLAQAMYQQAWLWDLQGRFRDANSEASRALKVFKKLGAANDADATRQLLRQIYPDDCKLLETILLVVHLY